MVELKELEIRWKLAEAKLINARNRRARLLVALAERRKANVNQLEMVISQAMELLVHDKDGFAPNETISTQMS